ncbi:hypothetical protein OG365_35465 [Streptomyces sp. NBC_00853]|uniref:hypothetical protein n=1 Tax=Streptomyces sp. NBC_00853 TaxID=2903681 RepID=UPI003873AE9C|nr:hypothetical protein OG365_35465 [Streptomyces sp. NBC_00853]
MTGVAEEETGDGGTARGGSDRPARRPLNELKPEVFENRPHKLALVQHLRSLIEAADLASKNVAPGAATSTSTLSRNLSGNRLPQRSTVEAIIQLCGATEEVRALSLRLHTAALGEAHPAFADRLVMADAYEETVLLHDRVQARLEAVTGEHRRQQADHDDLLARHVTTSRALTAAEDELRTRQRHHQQETARLRTLLHEEQDARRRDRTVFDAQLDRARAEDEERLRASAQEGARLRRDLLTQENEIQTVRSLLEDSAAEATTLRQERDRLRLESARLRGDLVGLQAELAAAEAELEDHRADRRDTELAPALQAIGQVLDRGTAPQEDDDVAGRPRVATGATQAVGSTGTPAPTTVSAPQTDAADSSERLPAGLVGIFAVSVLLVTIGLFQHTGPMAQARPTATGWWFIGSGLLLLVAVPVLLAVQDARNNPFAPVPGEPYDQTYDFPPMG